MKRLPTRKAISPDSSARGQGRARGQASLGSCDVRGGTLRPEVDCVCVCRGGGGARGECAWLCGESTPTSGPGFRLQGSQ